MEAQFRELMSYRNHNSNEATHSTTDKDFFLMLQTGDTSESVNLDSNQFKMNVFRMKNSDFEKIHIRKLSKKGDAKFTKKEKDFLQARGFEIDGEFATKSTM